MKEIDRRSLLRASLCGAVAAAVGSSLVLSDAEAAPLSVNNLANQTKRIVEDAQVVVVGPRRRHRRWHCWWRRGRRICGWRYW
jgi:hypothetical protein